MGSSRSGLEMLDQAPAVAIGVTSGAVVEGVGRRSFLHAGPPVEADELVGPMRGAVAGALVLEGEAADARAAEKLIAAGEVTLSPCHEAGGVGAMAGIVSPSIPVVLVEGADGEQTFAPLNEGLGKALRFGSNGTEIVERLQWMRRRLTPVLNAAIEAEGGVDLIALQEEALRRGDECHNRNVAATAALLVRLAPGIVRAAASAADAAEILEFIAGNPHFFLTFSMAAGKAVSDAAERAGEPGLVTAIAANGRRIGLRVSGVDGWVTAPAPLGEPRLFPGFELSDACPMMGDSFATECIGLGAFAITAAPAISSFIGATPEWGVDMVAQMRTITRSSSTRFKVPAESFAGTPLGIDVGLVESGGRTPFVNNGFAHRDPGVGQVGAGVTELPLEPFTAAATALAEGAR